MKRAAPASRGSTGSWMPFSTPGLTKRTSKYVKRLPDVLEADLPPTTERSFPGARGTYYLSVIVDSLPVLSN